MLPLVRLMMSKPTTDEITASQPNALFGCVVSILEQALGNVVRAVNTNMVLAYWLIGREIVQELQGGEERAAFCKQVVETLSARLTKQYGKAFSAQTLYKFRLFYQALSARSPNPSPQGRDLVVTGKISPLGTEINEEQIQYPADGELERLDGALPQGFSPQLSRSHYRALLRVGVGP